MATNDTKTTMHDDLFIKKVPAVIKELIGREAENNHRSINQEAIALLEEALLHRLESSQARRGSTLATLARYAAELGAEAPDSGPVPLSAPAAPLSAPAAPAPNAVTLPR